MVLKAPGVFPVDEDYCLTEAIGEQCSYVVSQEDVVYSIQDAPLQEIMQQLRDGKLTQSAARQAYREVVQYLERLFPFSNAPTFSEYYEGATYYERECEEGCWSIYTNDAALHGALLTFDEGLGPEEIYHLSMIDIVLLALAVEPERADAYLIAVVHDHHYPAEVIVFLSDVVARGVADKSYFQDAIPFTSLDEAGDREMYVVPLDILEHAAGLRAEAQEAQYQRAQQRAQQLAGVA